MADVPATVNSDGRYYWYGTFGAVTGGQITFAGDPALLTGTAALTWTILQRSGDGSFPVITYSTDGGVTPHSQQVGSEGTPQETVNESGMIAVTLNGATGLTINVTSSGGATVAGAKQWVLALAITRNSNEALPWDSPNAFDPLGYNAAFADKPGYLTDTLSNLRNRLAIRLGFSSQSANLPPGMTNLLNDFLIGSQRTLFRRFTSLQMRRFFRWKLVPGQRFYSLQDNDESPLSGFHMDPVRPVEWAGIQDTRNVWYPLMKGIPPTLYTMLQKSWRPARYDIGAGVEVYPSPDQTYWLWIKGFTGLGAFASDSDTTSIDSELVLLHALAMGKSHYGQPDANNYEAMANAYRGDIVAGTHATGHYVPGTTPIPPAVQPTLIQFTGS